MSKTNDITTKIQQLNDYAAWFEGDGFVLEESIEKFNEAKNLPKKFRRI